MRNRANALAQSHLRSRPAEVGEHVGPYELQGRLGRGGSAEVYTAVHVLNGRRVALKLLHAELIDNRHARRNLAAEHEVARRAKHPNVVEVHDYVDGARPYVVMELLQGETLRARLDRGGVLGVAEVLSTLIQIARALAALHRRDIVHGDLKPSNIFLQRWVDPGREVKLIDLGTARQLRGGAIARAEGEPIVGTPAYMAPEHLAGEAIDTRVDVFAFGVIAHEIFSGDRPRDAHTTPLVPSGEKRRAPRPWAMAAALPVELEGLIDACLATEPDDRPLNMVAVLEWLETIAAALPRGAPTKDRRPTVAR